MRWIVALLSFAALMRPLSAAEVEIVRVWPQWHNAESFDRIGEYFGREENTDGRQTVLRTRADARAGLYFLVRLKTSAPLSAAKFQLEIIRPDSPDAKSFTFPANVPANSHLFELGLTGADWPGGRSTHPVAWKLSLLDGAGRVVVSQQSFLWEKPAQP